MSKRVAVVTPTYGNSWSEEDVICRRLAGALATSVDVDVLVPAGGVARIDHDGAVRLVRLPAFPRRLGRRDALVRALLGPGDSIGPLACGCLDTLVRDLVDDLPRVAQQELVRAGGGDSPALWRWLEEADYDVVVFAGFDTASTVFGIGHVGARTRVVLLPLARHASLLRMRILDEPLERVDSIVVTSDTERSIMERCRGGDAPIWNTGFVLRVNPVVLAAPPHGFSENLRHFVIPGDWRSGDHRWVVKLARAVHVAFGPHVNLNVVGPGAVGVLRSGGEGLAESRSDVWRWASRSVGLIDPNPHRLLGRDVLESLMFGTPVVVAAEGGASREHAQVGNGGLWYRTQVELMACIGALLDPEIRRRLGEQGRDYAANGFADTDRYVKATLKAVLEEE